MPIAVKENIGLGSIWWMGFVVTATTRTTKNMTNDKWVLGAHLLDGFMKSPYRTKRKGGFTPPLIEFLAVIRDIISKPSV